jgi:acyl-CoA thioesterase II
MDASFTADTDGYDYQLPVAVDARSPAALEVQTGPGPFDQANLGPTPAEPDGTRASTSRAWFRLARRIGDDEHLHTALIAFISDMTLTGGRPLDLEGDTTGMISLDHAVWFHRPARADEWLLYDVHSLVNAGGRGLLRGTLLTHDRRLVASVTQEMRLHPLRR